MRWCPGVGCGRAIEHVGGGDAAGADAACAPAGCGAVFCWACGCEAHRPLACATVQAWLLKNSAESENMNWILAHTKPCPKCARPVEKNQGCMHMTCQAPCRFEWCWLCSGAWKEHGERTGGFYACNRYESARAAGEVSEAEARREHARGSLERYMHFYERWAEHGASHARAAAQLAAVNLEQLAAAQAQPVSQLAFVREAMRQIVACRRTLKWTYAFGFYSFSGDAPESGLRKRFFEYAQGEAEQQLERLTAAVEGRNDDQLQRFFEGPAPREEFDALRGRVAGLTAVTAKYFDALVAELERGLPAVGAPEEEEEAAEGGAGGAGGAGAGAQDAPAAAQAAAAPPAAAPQRCVGACACAER